MIQSALRIGLLIAIALPIVADGQIVRGSITARGDTVGIPGVVVLLLDSTGATVSRALSDARGDYRIIAPGAGRYRVRTMRVGFRPDTSEAIALSVGQEREHALAIANVVAQLDTVRVVDQRQCRPVESGEATAAVWDQVRTALHATQMTARLRSVNAAIITYERTLDANSERILEQSSGVISGLTVRPWVSLPPDSLRKVGYILTANNGSLSYLAPDLDVLLSPTFVGDHCFRVTRSRDTTLIGIVFESGLGRGKIPEIEGTLWLNRNSADLKRLEFRYTNVPREQSERAGGDMEFVRMSNGGFAIGRWAIKMPVIERQAAGRQLDRVVELKAVGGELSYAVNGKDTLYARAPLTLTGVVTDSTSGKPVEGARLTIVGTTLSSQTDARGRFSIAGVLPGQYTMHVQTEAFDAIKARVEWPVLFSAERTAVAMKIPSVADVARARSATLTGVVVADSTGVPLAGADITFPQIGLFTLADAAGAFRVPEIPPGTYDVRVRRVGYGPLITSLTFPERATVDRRVVLSRLVVLDTVIVEAESPLLEFEANRKLGLGKFLTRAQLDKMQGRRMGAVLSEIKGIGIVFGHTTRSYIGSTRATNSVSIQQGYNKWAGANLPPGVSALDMMRKEGFVPPHIWCPDQIGPMVHSQGLKCGCYAQVYLDRMLLNPGEPTEPFDVNSISPDLIEGIEYYANAASTPMKYQARNASCGVLVIHRRRNLDKPKADDKKPAKPPS